MRDTFTPIRQLGRRGSMSGSRSRMFGLDASDRTRLVKNSDSEAEGGGNPTVNPCQQLLITKLTPVITRRVCGMATSLLLLGNKLMISDKVREVAERVEEERMWEMEREVDKKLRMEVEKMNNK